jgi:glycosyltransferase involved in cell wall biosynthesis
MLTHLVRAQEDQGAECVVVMPSAGEGWLGRELSQRDTAIRSVEMVGASPLHCLPALVTAFRAARVQLIHSHEFNMAVYGAAVARRLGVPHVITMHGSRYYADTLRRKLLMRVAIALSGQLVAVSERLARHLREDLHLRASSVCCIPNGIPPVPRGDVQLRAELGLESGTRLLLAIGNLYPVKGHRFLVEALGLLRQEGWDLHVAIAGRGGEEQLLRALAASAGLTDRVHLLGLRSDIGNLLHGTDIFVMPSLSEGLPIALLEAMHAGCTIVASDVGEIPIALDHANAGRVVAPGDSSQLAATLGELLSDPAEMTRLGASAAARAIAEYDVSRMEARYREVYLRFLAPHRRAS